MTNQFKSLILYPTVFIVVLLGVLTASNSYLAFLVFILVVGEQIFSWNKSLQNYKNTDFRLFFASQYLNIIYILLIFPLYLLSSFLWSQINFWILFGYGLNFLIFRSIAKVGTDQLSKTNYSESREIKSSLEIWKSNKNKLSSVIAKTSNKTLREKLKDKLEYSSFLNSEEATLLLNQAEKASNQELDKLLIKINDLM
jgi:ribosomal protein L9